MTDVDIYVSACVNHDNRGKIMTDCHENDLGKSFFHVMIQTMTVDKN